MMTLKRQIEDGRGNALALERLYRQSLASGDEPAFREAIAHCAREYPDDALFAAWAYRLDIRPLEAPAAEKVSPLRRAEMQQWWMALLGSAILGLLYALLAGNKPPIPVPDQGSPAFWLGWAPFTAWGVLLYLAALDGARGRARWYGAAALTTALIALPTAWIAWGWTGYTANLIALHLPFVVWAAVGGALAWGHPHAARELSAYIVKSVEVALTGGIYLGAAMLFLMLTYGMFLVLGIRFSEDAMRTAMAWIIGAIPLLAVASVYDPSRSPSGQEWTVGLARLLRIIVRLLLPLALGVLLIYVFWFIPLNFWRPFQERETLVVYNAAIIAIIALFICAVPGPDEARSLRYGALLRWGILATGFLAFLLNAYALAAILSRTLEHGLTPNRHAVLGWNIVTLLMLVTVLVRLWRAEAEGWAEAFRQSMGRAMVLAIAWALWVVLGLPWF